MKYLITIILLAFSNLLHANVYDLKVGASEEAIHALLKPKLVMKEKVVVNGKPGNLKVHTIDLKMRDCAEALRDIVKRYDKSKVKHGAILIDIPKEDIVTRYYVFSAGDKYKTLCFQLDMPKTGLKENARDFWPKGLPEPRGAKINQVMVLSKRDTIYASFSSEAMSRQVYYEYSDQLKGIGWAEISSDKRNGAVYMNPKTKQLMIFNTLDNGKETHAGIYIYKIKKTP